MGSLEIFAIGWAVIALILFGVQANQAQIKQKHEDRWEIKSTDHKADKN